MSRWLIEETGDGDDGFCWNLFELSGGNLKMRATLYSKQFARDVKSAMDWLDTLSSGRMSLAAEGLKIDPITGKISSRQKPRQADLVKPKATMRKRTK